MDSNDSQKMELVNSGNENALSEFKEEEKL